MYTNGIKEWQLNKQEVGYNVEAGSGHYSAGASTWKIYIAKLMPMVTKGYAKLTTIKLDSSLFSNASGCMPVSQSTIHSQNYITVSRGEYSFSNPYKNHNMQVEIEVLNDNMDNLRVTNYIDKTYDID